MEEKISPLCSLTIHSLIKKEKIIENYNVYVRHRNCNFSVEDKCLAK